MATLQQMSLDGLFSDPGQATEWNTHVVAPLTTYFMDETRVAINNHRAQLFRMPPERRPERVSLKDSIRIIDNGMMAAAYAAEGGATTVRDSVRRFVLDAVRQHSMLLGGGGAPSTAAQMYMASFPHVTGPRDNTGAHQPHLRRVLMFLETYMKKAIRVQLEAVAATGPVSYVDIRKLAMVPMDDITLKYTVSVQEALDACFTFFFRQGVEYVVNTQVRG